VQDEQIRSTVLATLASIAPEADLRRIRPDQLLRPQVDLDSMDWLNVIAGLSERLSVEIPEADYGRLTTLDSIVAYLAYRKTRQPGEPSATAAKDAGGLAHTQHTVKGTRVTVRPIRPDDLPLEADFVRHLSMETRYQRFMLTIREISQTDLHYLTEVDQVRHVALVATVDRDGRQVLIGAVRYIVDSAGTGCEFAVAIDDAWHGSGLAGILMHALMDVARSRGLRTMEGFVLTTNSSMLKFARRLGFTQEHDPGDRETVRVLRSL